jgi:hypothetical protein
MWYLAHQQAREIIAAREREADRRRLEHAAHRGRDADPDRRARMTGPASARRWAARRVLAASRLIAHLARLLDPGTIPDGSSPAR